MSWVTRSRKQRSWTAWLFTGSMLVLGFGCSGKSERTSGSGDDDEAGAAGSDSGGTAGSSPSGGSGAMTGGGGATSGAGGKGGTGTGASSGSATGGASGSAGTTSVGGSSGSAGAGEGGTGGAGGASPRECETEADCQMLSDCCGCRAEPRDGGGMPCALPCVRDACAEEQIGLEEVACNNGRCVISRPCDAGNVTCRSARPICPSGTVPSVLGSCWGPCLAPTECTNVTSCADCGAAACVEFTAQLSIFSCVAPVAGCNAGSYCGCLDACQFSCSEREGGVACDCPVC